MNSGLVAFYGLSAFSAFMSPYFPRCSLALALSLAAIPVLSENKFHLFKAIIAISAPSYIQKLVELCLTKLALEKYKRDPESREFKETLERAGEIGIMPVTWKRLFHPFCFFDIKDICFCKYPMQSSESYHNLLSDFGHVVPRFLLYNTLFWSFLHGFSSFGHLEFVYSADAILTFLIKYVFFIGMTLTFLDVIDYSTKLNFLLFGFHVDIKNKVQDNPILSLSLKEFWSDRWNYLIQKLVLKKLIYDPICFNANPFEPHLSFSRQKQPMWKVQLAAFFTFLLSGIWHALPVWMVYGNLSIHPPLDVTMNGNSHDEHHYGFWFGWGVVAFFVAQFFGIAIEHHLLKIKEWPEVYRRIWTASFIVLTYPLMAFPFMTLWNV
ncbi:hypothetical protein MP638_003555 [Amoeboaphelidium occidentale]|nr:hypothetical protein MP638_003555 [Amoeboaphelidium occidentale]